MPRKAETIETADVLSDQSDSPDVQGSLQERQAVILVAAGPGAMIRVELDGPATVAADGVKPPVCGSCDNYFSGLCRRYREAVKPSDMSCTAHQWQAGYSTLVTTIGRFRRTGQAHLIRELQQGFHEADEKEARHLQALELGLRPAVKLEAMDVTPPVPKKVVGVDGTGLADVAWVDPGGNVTPVKTRGRVEY